MEPKAAPVGVLGMQATLASAPAAEDDVTVDDDFTEPPPSFADFYSARRDQIARALALTLRDGDLASEAVDEAMVRAYQRWDRIGSFTDPGGWVYRVGLNWATSVLRRRRRAPAPVIGRDAPDRDIDAVAEPDVLIALGELPVSQRAAVVCRFYLGLSEQETAEALNVRPGTVKSRLHRGLQHLQVRLAHLSPKEQG